MKRTPREWTETCRTCRGSGQTHHRQHFALWTPDEFEPQPLDPKHDVPSDALVCTAVYGSSIFEACREGVELAQMTGRPIAFECNGSVAILRADSDPVAIAKAWWKRAYGRTYEQSMAER
jgi:hypothetical protein